MSNHELKTDPEVFMSSWAGEKTFEIRLNDRDFQPRDSLLLRETVCSGEEMSKGAALEYTGREIEQTVLHVLHGPAYGIEDGWVILSVENEDYIER